MQNKTYNTNQLISIETECLHERFTGRRYGYKLKAEYEYKKTQTEAIYHRIFVVCREIQPKSPQVNVVVSMSCSPHKIEERVEFIVTDEFSKGSRKFLESIVEEAFKRCEILERSNEQEKKTK